MEKPIETKAADRPTQYNLGASLARIVFSFLVICNHFYSGGIGSFWILPLRKMAVPLFFVLAFYFGENMNPPNRMALMKRLRRILFPLWFWGLVFAPVYFAGFLRHGLTFENATTAIWRIMLQVVMGHVYDAPLWFLFDLALLTSAWSFATGSRLVRKHTIRVLFSFFLAAFLFQYSGWNSKVFSQFNWFVRYPLGRLAECIPFAAIGIALAKSGIVFRISASPFKWFVLAGIGLLCWPLPLACFTPATPPGFGYQGLTVCRSGAFLAAFFLILPLNRIPYRLRQMILAASGYSLGIYCIHVPVGKFLFAIVGPMMHYMDPFFRCLGIHAVCWVLCFLFAKLFPEAKRLVQ